MSVRFSAWAQEGLALLGQVISRRNLFVVAGVIVCAYSIWTLLYVQTIPDLGFKSAFDTTIKGEPRLIVVEGQPVPQQGDIVHQIGDREVGSWPDLLRAPFEFEKRLLAELHSNPDAIERIHADEIIEAVSQYKSDPAKPYAWVYRVQDGSHEYFLVRAVFLRSVTGEPMTAWCALDRLPANELFPAILWFVLKLLLFVVGALVLWKRPGDRASALFFMLCVVTLGAYMGGYHWPYISLRPELLIGFMVCAILLPAVTLHFYLVFPRPKAVLTAHRNWVLLTMYGLPLLFLVILLWQYLHFRELYQAKATAATLEDSGYELVHTVYVYLGFASLLYLLSVVALIHSFVTAADLTERNQVKCILLGAALALVPLGYSLYLILFEPNRFGAGGATWPMFAASLCITAAFLVSITRYRLMELDQIISSGAVYFLISFLVGLGYYAVVIVGTLLFNQVLPGPPLSEALRVSTIALVLLVALDLARTRLRKALDRRFHREKYHLDRTLQRMSEAVQQLVDPPTLVQRLLYAASDLLGVTRGSVYLRQPGLAPYRLAGWVGPAPAHPDLAADGPLVTALAERGVVTPFGRFAPPRAEAREQLRQLGGEVAHALAQEGRVLAFLVLGAKASGSYRQEDLNLLSAFAQLTVLALGNAEGHKAIETLNVDLQTKVEKIAEQQRRIFALQSQLRRQGPPKLPVRGLLVGGISDKPLPASMDMTTSVKNLEAMLATGAEAPSTEKIVGSSQNLRQLLQMVRKVAKADAVVLIRGESGTGKELLAEAVHQTSTRADKALVKVHCAALSPTLLESELFGHVKGAFTGAHRDKVGRFELASGGTLFLDEIGDISLEVQTKLLRVLQEKTYERVGASDPVKADVRIIAATHQNLEELIRQGRFREDLYYRLNVFPIYVPPLRERPEDIAELALHFLVQAGKRTGKIDLCLDDDALSLLKAYAWPGNIRELENVIERAVVLAEGNTIGIHDLPAELRHLAEHDGLTGESPWPEGIFADNLEPGAVSIKRSDRDRLERDHLLRALQVAGGNKALAARHLGIARSTLVSRLKKLGIA